MLHKDGYKWLLMGMATHSNVWHCFLGSQSGAHGMQWLVIPIWEQQGSPFEVYDVAISENGCKRHMPS